MSLIRNNRAQSTIELAAFGIVLLFMIGVILRQSLNQNYAQHQSLKAARLASKLSYEFSEGLRGAGGFDGTASRNSATVIFIEDRLVAGSGKYGAINRTPQVIGGSATLSRNLMMPIEGEDYNFPTMDMFINGQHFPFTTAGFGITEAIAADPHTQVPNHPDLGYKPDCMKCFDLDRNGIFPDIPVALMPFFEWQWQHVDYNQINLDTGEFLVLDIDQDLTEETIIDMGVDVGSTIAVISYIDPDEGDIDLTIGFGDFEYARRPAHPIPEKGDPLPVNGLTEDIQIITTTHKGTELRIEEGNVFTGAPNIRTTSTKLVVDTITRVIQLRNDTGRFCKGNTPTATVGGLGMYNYVQVCTNSIKDCLHEANVDKTCMARFAPGGPLLFVRSLIIDHRGRRWTINRADDPAVDFIIPELPN